MLPVSEGLLDDCGLGPELVGDSDGDALGAPIPALPGAAVAGDDPETDGTGELGVAVLTGDPPPGTAMALLLSAGDCRICSICRWYRCSRARISVRLNEVMCRPKARTCFQSAASCAAAEPCGAAGNERSTWIAIAAVRQVMQL